MDDGGVQVNFKRLPLLTCHEKSTAQKFILKYPNNFIQNKSPYLYKINVKNDTFILNERKFISHQLFSLKWITYVTLLLNSSPPNIIV